MTINCIFQIDAQDRVVFLGGAWTAFARENSGQKLINEPPIGRPLWEYIKGASTRNLYYVLIKEVRETGRTIRFPFRCDSPKLLRYMEMELSPAPDEAIQFRTSIFKVIELSEDTPPPAPAPQSDDLVQMCAWCNQVLVGSEWLSIEDAIWMLGLFDAPEAPPITHGMCPNCINTLREEALIKKTG